MTAPRVSDHALLRFLERGAGLDVEALRLRLEDSLARAHQAARSLGTEEYLIKADGLVYVVRGDVVTTIMEQKSPVAHAASLVQRPV